MGFLLNTIGIRDDLTTLLRTNVALLNASVLDPITDVNRQIINSIYLDNPFSSPELPIFCIYQIGKPSEEFAGIGAGGRKNVVINFEIMGIIRRVKDSTIDVKYIDEITHFANNTDYVLRENIKFSCYIISSNPENYELIVNQQDEEEGIYTCMFKTQLSCQVDVIKCTM